MEVEIGSGPSVSLLYSGHWNTLFGTCRIFTPLAISLHFFFIISNSQLLSFLSHFLKKKKKMNPPPVYSNGWSGSQIKGGLKVRGIGIVRHRVGYFWGKGWGHIQVGCGNAGFGTTQG